MEASTCFVLIYISVQLFTSYFKKIDKNTLGDELVFFVCLLSYLQVDAGTGYLYYMHGYENEELLNNFVKMKGLFSFQKKVTLVHKTVALMRNAF
jgi:hypothetical protein